MQRIHVVRSFRRLPFPATSIKALARRILRTEQISEYQLTFVGVDDERIAGLNRTYVHHSGPTDVISFPLETDHLEGEIYISLERAREQSRQYGVSYRSEVHRLAAHGLLHLIGYDDLTPPEKRVMTRKENYYLKQVRLYQS